MKFPTLTASNLLKQKLTLPQDFEGELNLLFVPFWQWHQMEVDSWGALVKQLEEAHHNLRYYELPTIQRMNPLAHFFIDEGMRGGIPNPRTRSRTITLYIDKKPFRKALEMTDEDHIYLLLIDRQGNLLWRTRGANQSETAQSLVAAIEQLIPAAV